MSEKPKVAPHKLGANSKDPAKKSKKKDKNFSQSRDIHEDRGQREAKERQPPHTV